VVSNEVEVNKKNNPKISVIIPLFNQKKYVGYAIDSVLNQTYSDIEIIVVNDGSTDNPFPELKKYEKKILLINQENKGLSGARNAGIMKSTGEYIQLLDADDFLHMNKIELQMLFAMNKDEMISYCEVVQYDSDSGQTALRYIGEIKDMFISLYNFWLPYPVPVHSLIIKKDIFNKFGLFDEELKACEDRYFFSKLAAAGVDFKYFPFIGGVRRLHSSNMNKNRLHMVENTIRYYGKLNEELGDRYFMEKFGYTGFHMMCANMTYIYGVTIGENTSRNELKQIKKILKKEQLEFNALPILLGYNKFKLKRFFMSFYIRRWFKTLISKYF
jgi:glycosyltransferase involved in cell wall biosynthesis